MESIFSLNNSKKILYKSFGVIFYLYFFRLVLLASYSSDKQYFRVLPSGEKFSCKNIIFS